MFLRHEVCITTKKYLPYEPSPNRKFLFHSTIYSLHVFQLWNPFDRQSFLGSIYLEVVRYDCLHRVFLWNFCINPTSFNDVSCVWLAGFLLKVNILMLLDTTVLKEKKYEMPVDPILELSDTSRGFNVSSEKKCSALF